ncbi:hypothetical protein EI94DRAFT_1754266 [Lactarius quietus]|nr:hypothetical protein EI94DRAFT_1754266 [Lactarius quietus]
MALSLELFELPQNAPEKDVTTKYSSLPGGSANAVKAASPDARQQVKGAESHTPTTATDKLSPHIPGEPPAARCRYEAHHLLSHHPRAVQEYTTTHVVEEVPASRPAMPQTAPQGARHSPTPTFARSSACARLSLWGRRSVHIGL